MEMKKVTFLGVNENNLLVPINIDQREEFTDMSTTNYTTFSKGKTKYRLAEITLSSFKGDNPELKSYQVKLIKNKTKSEFTFFIQLDDETFKKYKNAVSRNERWWSKLAFEQKIFIIGSVAIAIVQILFQFLIDLIKHYVLHIN